MAFLPFLLGAAGAGFGALSNHKHPFLGALGGAAMGGLGGAGLGALGSGLGGAAGAAAAAAGAAGGFVPTTASTANMIAGTAPAALGSYGGAMGSASQGLGMLGKAQKLAGIFSTLRGQGGQQLQQPQDNYMAMPTPIPPLQQPQGQGALQPVQTSSMFPRSQPFPQYGGGYS